LTADTNNEFNKAADHIRYTIGANAIPCNSREKTPNFDYIKSWTKWQDEPIPEELHNEWKARGAFNNGLAIVLGKLFHNNIHLFLNGIDADNQKAIVEICTRYGKTISIQELAQWTYVEQHDDRPDRMHMLIYSEGKPFTKKSSDQSKLGSKLDANEIPAIEIKNEGSIFYVAPSIHRDKNTGVERPYQIIGTDIPVLSNSFENNIDNILSKYGIPYLNNNNESGNGNAAKIPIEDLFAPDLKIYEGHNRHEALLRAMESLIQRNKDILSEERIKQLAYEWNSEHCVPPLDNREFEKQWKCAARFIFNSNNNGKANNSNNNNDDDVSKNKSKQVILDITDELLSRYTFKTLKDTEEIYYYDIGRGIYVTGCESLIKSEAENIAPDISTNQVNEIINHIIRRTLTDRSEFDADIEWLALKNRMINLLTLETRPHSPEYMATIRIPIPYDDKNNNCNDNESPISQFFECIVDPISHPCPKIMNFMYEVVAAPEDVQTILDFIAYCLWRAFPFHKYILFNGGGRNGKGTMLRLIKRLLGPENISGESLHRILDNRFAVAELYGKLANIDADMSTEALRNTGILKKLTGGDPIPAERKFKPPFKFVNYAKLLFSANEIPQTPDETDAFFARLIIINFPKQFIEGANADPYLFEKISTDKELSGFLYILLKRLPKVLKRGISTASSSIPENYDKYILSSDPIRAFDEACIRIDKDDSTRKISKEVVYQVYRNFCLNKKVSIESEQSFSRRLKEARGYQDKQARNDLGIKAYYWVGIKIVDWLSPAEEDQETLI
jgi:P4 family phage/plasmid primase-like protien